jgi:ribosomal protein S26
MMYQNGIEHALIDDTVKGLVFEDSLEVTGIGVNVCVEMAVHLKVLS